MRKSGFALVLLLALNGCATSRGMVSIQVPAALPSTSARTLTIAQISDDRTFEIKPSEPSIPSLKNDEISDTAITARAVARKRNSYGKALGDILLPEGQTVAMLVEQALTSAFTEAGYRVVAAGEPGYDEAARVSASIEQFWSWFTPGFWAAHLEFETRVRLDGDVSGLKSRPLLRGYVRLATQAATTRAWENTIHKGIEDFIANVKAQLSAGDQPES